MEVRIVYWIGIGICICICIGVGVGVGVRLGVLSWLRDGYAISRPDIYIQINRYPIFNFLNLRSTLMLS